MKERLINVFANNLAITTYKVYGVPMSCDMVWQSTKNHSRKKIKRKKDK